MCITATGCIRQLSGMNRHRLTGFNPHARLQIDALALAKERMREGGLASQAALGVHIKFVGGCRNAQDRERMAQLQEYADARGVGDSVEFRPDVPMGELHGILSAAVAGLHSMVDEHFGISVVEYMAAGVVAIAHDSGAPLFTHLLRKATRRLPYDR